MSKYFQTGSYNTTCDNKGAFDFEGAKNCTQVTGSPRECRADARLGRDSRVGAHQKPASCLVSKPVAAVCMHDGVRPGLMTMQRVMAAL